MKRFNLVHMLVILATVVTVASCGMTQPLYEDGYESRTSRRVYSDPYYGGQTVLVRDPYTGQIYEAPLVTPYGGGYGYPNTYPSGRYYGNGGYSRGYSRNYPRTNQNSGSYNNNNNNNNNNNGSSNSNSPQKGSEKIDRAKDIINGRN